MQAGCVTMWKGADFEVTFIGSQAQVDTVTYEKEVFYFQLQGSSTLSTSHGDITLKDRTMIVLPPRTTHSSRVSLSLAVIREGRY